MISDHARMTRTFSSRDGSWRRGRLRDARLYVCTDLARFLDAAGTTLDVGALREFFASCYRGGVDIIQVRDKKAGVRVEVQALDVLVETAAAHGGLAAANDRADVALLAGVDVFHVGQTDLTTSQARAILGEEIVLGRSCHTREQVDEARHDPAMDYYCTGPVWETPTKPGRAAVGLELPRYAAAAGGDKPFFAIGGIDARTLPRVTDAGASRVVVVRAVTQADDAEAAARHLCDALPTRPGS